jgi:hypothetical protein
VRLRSQETRSWWDIGVEVKKSEDQIWGVRARRGVETDAETTTRTHVRVSSYVLDYFSTILSRHADMCVNTRCKKATASPGFNHGTSDDRIAGPGVL